MVLVLRANWLNIDEGSLNCDPTRQPASNPPPRPPISRTYSRLTGQNHKITANSSHMKYDTGEEIVVDPLAVENETVVETEKYA